MTITLSPLERTDGSASYSSNGYTVLCGVNGPIEVQRRDELPEEAAIEVNIRPASGVGGIRERHLETILLSTLRRVLLLSAHPRSLIQVTLQVVASQEDERRIGGLPQAASNIEVLPSLIQASILALLSTSLPLLMTMCAVLVAITTDSSTTTPAVELLPNPTLKNISEASSVHVLAFSSKGDLLLVESEGEFVVDEWERVYEVAREACLGDRRLGKEDGGDERSRDVEMEEDGDKEGLLWKMQRVVGEKVESEQRWKKDLG